MQQTKPSDKIRSSIEKLDDLIMEMEVLLKEIRAMNLRMEKDAIWNLMAAKNWLQMQMNNFKREDK